MTKPHAYARPDKTARKITELPNADTATGGSEPMARPVSTNTGSAPAISGHCDLRRHFGPDICVDAKLSNLSMLAADARPFIEHAIMLARKRITMYVDPAPKSELFLPLKESAG